MPLPLLSLLLLGPTAQMLCLGVLHCGKGCPRQLWNVVLIKEDSLDRAGGGCGGERLEPVKGIWCGYLQRLKSLK